MGRACGVAAFRYDGGMGSGSKEGVWVRGYGGGMANVVRGGMFKGGTAAVQGVDHQLHYTSEAPFT